MTVTTLRPNAEAIKNHAVTLAGGATSYGVTSDGSDSTYMQGQVDKMYLRMAFGSLTIGAGQRVKSCQLRIRNARDGLGGATQDTLTGITTNTISHLGLAQPVGQFLSTRGLTTIATSAGPIAYCGPGGRVWDQSLLDDICLITYWYKAHSGVTTYFQRVHELYIDVDINNQPVITGAPAVTNYVNNAKPTVSWLWYDADDDVQAAFRVKIFDSATYSAAGFNADTSRPIWDSGQLYGVDSQLTVGMALLNGVTYKAYVNVAQSWPGPQGKYWWSGWSASASFAVAFTPPATPTIQSAGVVTDVNQYRAVFSILAPVNLLSLDNASFETSLGNWAALTNGQTPVRDTAQHADGAASMRMQPTATGDMVYRCTTDANKQPQVQPGEQLTVLGNFKANTTGRACSIGVQWLDNTGAQIGANVYGSDATDSTANFNTQAVLTATAPGGAYQANILARVKAANEQHWVDMVSIAAGSSTTWTPGGMTNDQGDLILERAEYVLGDRGPADNWFHPQIASCGSTMKTHEYGFSGNPANSADTIQWRWLDKQIPAPDGETPVGMLDYAPGVTTSPYLRWGEWNQNGTNTAYMVLVVQGQIHGFCVWAWTDTGSVTMTPVIDWRDVSGVIVSSTNGTQVTVTTTPQRLFVTGTPPANAVFATGAVVNNGAVQAGVRWRFTRAGFGMGTIPVDGKPARGVPSGLNPNGVPAGIDWDYVRFRDDGETMGSQVTTQYPPARRSGQQLLFADYEYAPGRPVLYRASIAYTAQGQVTKSPYAYTVVYGTPPTITMLRSVTDPTLQIAISRRKEASFEVADDAAIFHPLGANGAAVRIRDWIGGEDAQSLVVVTTTEQQTQRLSKVVRSSDTMQLQWPQGGHTYMLITSRGTIPEYQTADVDTCDIDGMPITNLKHRATQLSYVETVAP